MDDLIAKGGRDREHTAVDFRPRARRGDRGCVANRAPNFAKQRFAGQNVGGDRAPGGAFVDLMKSAKATTSTPSSSGSATGSYPEPQPTKRPLEVFSSGNSGVVIPSGKRARLCRTHQPAPLAEERRIKIQCDLGPAKTFGDADRLGQLITNLLTNAIYYNKPSGEIRVSTRSENGGAVLAVADSGEGIAVEDLPHVFERFYRADKSRSRAEGRSGLGLAICKAIVDSHGGSIDVTSRPGAGTTFTVRLPALAAG
jgi:anti-sigma regulatory factor (Ser/Thr protein kinase)